MSYKILYPTLDLYVRDIVLRATGRPGKGSEQGRLRDRLILTYFLDPTMLRHCGRMAFLMDINQAPSTRKTALPSGVTPFDSSPEGTALSS